LQFLYALIVFVFIQFVVASVLRMFSPGPEIRGRCNLACGLKWATIFVLVFYMLVTVYSAITAERVMIWPFLNGLLIGLLILFSAVKRDRSSDLMMLVTSLSVSIAVIGLSLLIDGPMPITQDEGRFAGFAYRIIQDGRWMPYAYFENTYYQFFHVIPYLQAVLSLITGQDVIYSIHPIVVLTTTLLACLGIYIVLKRFIPVHGTGLAVLGPTLIALTPPISMLGFIPPNLAIALYLSSLAAFSIFRKSNNHMLFISVVLISVTGVITHATYSLLLLTTLIPLLFSWGNNAEPSEKRLLKSVLRLVSIVSILTLTYWAHTLIMDMLATTGKVWTDSLIELITGEIKPFETVRPVWYFRAPAELACSWTLLPALTTAYIFTQAVPRLASLTNFKKTIQDLRSDPFFNLGVIGTLLIALALAFKATPWGPTRYFYPFYLLLMPTSSLVIGKIADKKGIMSITLIVIMISAISFYAIQDPAISPDIHQVVLLANKRSWIVAESLVQHASPNLRYRVEPRVEIGFEALTGKFMPLEIFGSTAKSDELLILNYDELGELWADYRFEEATLQAIKNGEYSVVFSDGSYKAYYIRR